MKLRRNISRSVKAGSMDDRDHSDSERAPVPLYFQISSELQRRIKSGELQPGSRVPGEKEIAEEYGVSAITARAAMRVLLDQNLIARFPGRGTFVTEWNKVKANWGLGSMEDILTTGIKSQMSVVGWKFAEAPAWVSEKMHMMPGAKCLLVQLVRSCDGEPFLLTNAYYPSEIAAKLKKSDFTKPTARSKLAIAIVEEICHVRVRELRQTMSAELTDTETAKHLNIRPGSPILTVIRENYSEGRKLIQLARSHYRTDRYRFKINLSHIDLSRKDRSWT